MGVHRHINTARHGAEQSKRGHEPRQRGDGGGQRQGKTKEDARQRHDTPAAVAVDERAGQRHRHDGAERPGEQRPAEYACADAELFLGERNVDHPAPEDGPMQQEDGKDRVPGGYAHVGRIVMRVAATRAGRLGPDR